MNQVYYYTPEIPMFIVTRECEVVRIRVACYENGNFIGAKVDYNALEPSCSFLPLSEFLPDAAPFYCSCNNPDGEQEMDKRTVKEMAKLVNMNETEAARRIMNSCKKVCCPHAINEENARVLVFGNA